MSTLLHRFAQIALLATTVLVGCAAPVEGEEEGSTESNISRGSAKDLAVGFNGPSDQFSYIDAYYATEKRAGADHLCHTYISWKAADEASALPFAPNAPEPPAGTRAYLEYWLQHAQGHCSDVLLTFKSLNPGPVPTQKDYVAEIEKFLSVDWKGLTGFTGHFSYTAWNEPNNKADDGNGLGKVIPPDVAARLYLSLANRCKNHGCTAAAGDFASNGQMWLDMQVNADSYLDKYKAVIANEAKGYDNLGAGFRPAVFAFHGWHDVNNYIEKGDHASTYGTSVVREVVKSMSGTWTGVEIWDTETGMGQKDDLSDAEQACATAFNVSLHTIDARITRMYLTRLHRGTTQLYSTDEKSPRAAVSVLSNRQTTAPNAKCK